MAVLSKLVFKTKVKTMVKFSLVLEAFFLIYKIYPVLSVIHVLPYWAFEFPF